MAKQEALSTRRFLSLCMEDIEPVMEMRGKDAMYQCCYCQKWCSMGGTRALSKHIENEHRPQVIVQIQSFSRSLDVKIQPSETKTVYIGFLPLQHWNVHLEAAIQYSEGSRQWASLFAIHQIKEGGDNGQGRQQMQLKMTSAKPYLPRPTWSEAEHAKQRVGLKIADSIEELSNGSGGADRAPAGFAIKVEAPAKVLGEPLQAEISLTLNVHGKATTIILPLTISNDPVPQNGSLSHIPAALPAKPSAVASTHPASVGGLDDEDLGSAPKRAKVQGAADAGMGDASGMAHATMVAAQQHAMAQHLAASQLAHQAMAMRAMQQAGGAGMHPLLYVNRSLPMHASALGDISIDASAHFMRHLPPQHQPHHLYAPVGYPGASPEQQLGGQPGDFSLGAPQHWAHVPQ